MASDSENCELDFGCAFHVDRDNLPTGGEENGGAGIYVDIVVVSYWSCKEKYPCPETRTYEAGITRQECAREEQYRRTKIRLFLPVEDAAGTIRGCFELAYIDQNGVNTFPNIFDYGAREFWKCLTKDDPYGGICNPMIWRNSAGEDLSCKVIQDLCTVIKEGIPADYCDCRDAAKDQSNLNLYTNESIRAKTDREQRKRNLELAIEYGYHNSNQNITNYSMPGAGDAVRPITVRGQTVVPRNPCQRMKSCCDNTWNYWVDDRGDPDGDNPSCKFSCQHAIANHPQFGPNGTNPSPECVGEGLDAYEKCVACCRENYKKEKAECEAKYCPDLPTGSGHGTKGWNFCMRRASDSRGRCKCKGGGNMSDIP